jgi:hypothetical protein
MAFVAVPKALVQGAFTHEAAKPREKAIDTYRRFFDKNTGEPYIEFMVEDRRLDDAGNVKVNNYLKCHARGEVATKIEAAQWTEVALAGTLNWNRDYKSLTIEVQKVEVAA